jgi:histidinol-phosphate aminotransferase
VIVTTPNNPTGTTTPLSTIRAILAATDAIVVVDEAYQEFARDPGQTALTLLGEFGNLVVARTMSKAFALAGGRLGYFAAAPAIVDACRIVRLPYHLSAQTQALARVALAHAPGMPTSVCSVPSLTGMMSGNGCSTAASWCARSGRPAGSGCRSGPPSRPSSSMRRWLP